MKTILSENYKKSKFEGQVYTPEEEDEWVEDIVRQKRRQNQLPSLSTKNPVRRRRPSKRTRIIPPGERLKIWDRQS